MFDEDVGLDVSFYEPSSYEKLKACFSKCQMCNKRGLTVRIRRQSTAYVDDDRNWNTMHKDCFELAEQEWDDLWKEYYQGLL